MSSAIDDSMNSDDLPNVEPFDEAQLTDASERLIRRSLLFRRLRYFSFLVVGIGLGAVALYSLGDSRGGRIDRTLLASASFVNVRGNEKEIQISATAANGRFGIALGFRADSPVVEQTPGVGSHIRFSGKDQPATFLLPEQSSPIYIVVTDTPAEAIVRKYFNDRIEAGPPFDDPAKTMEKLKDHLLGLGYATLDIQKVNSP